MKSILIGIFALLLSANMADARSGHSYGAYHHSTFLSSTNRGVHYTHSYRRADGTYVHGYYATNPNRTRNDNFSTRGNVNPYTGKPGTKPRDGE